ncbi:heavy metal-associated isoprenylated plant protein 4 isoform X2 [Cornus florida]|uniref:heavy metal-associated isoprenylated plant protein 4 isoform X2 n=1 Tax=Cornus florida TaxID=4283 RepID=UPI00289A056C|nr:heavy metal-associated isoprenylated plant protein 4 isoform X2 [Cornus florida]
MAMGRFVSLVGTMSKEDKKEKVESAIIAVYKAHLHCPKCAYDIRKPLMRTPGVHSVDVKFESGEITVKGTFDAKKMHERIERISKKKVVKVKEEVSVLKEIKKETIRTTKINAYMHCDQCERDLRTKLLKNKGIHNVKTDMKAQTLTIEGTIESEKLLAFMKKRVHKHAEIISPKQDKKEEKKEDKEEKKDKKEDKKEDKEEKKDKKEEKKEDKKEEKKEDKVTVEVKTKETTEIIEFKEEKKVEAKTKEGNVPYFIHYVYAPQLFSDENPNACSIM